MPLRSRSKRRAEYLRIATVLGFLLGLIALAVFYAYAVKELILAADGAARFAEVRLGIEARP